MDEFLAMEQLAMESSDMGAPALSTPDPLGKGDDRAYQGSPARSTNDLHFADNFDDSAGNDAPSNTRAQHEMLKQRRRWQEESDAFRSQIRNARSRGTGGAGSGRGAWDAHDYSY